MLDKSLQFLLYLPQVGIFKVLKRSHESKKPQCHCSVGLLSVPAELISAAFGHILWRQSL